jgi:hypothetical protein
MPCAVSLRYWSWLRICNCRRVTFIQPADLLTITVATANLEHRVIGVNVFLLISASIVFLAVLLYSRSVEAWSLHLIHPAPERLQPL